MNRNVHVAKEVSFRSFTVYVVDNVSKNIKTSYPKCSDVVGKSMDDHHHCPWQKLNETKIKEIGDIEVRISRSSALQS